MEQSIPKTQKQLVWSGEPGKYEWKEVDVPTPQEGQVLIKVASSVIDPVDLMQISGHFAPFGFTKGSRLGFEGSGTVVAAKGAEAEKFIGKRIAGMSLRTGFYSDYHVLSVNEFCVLDDDKTWEDGAVLYDQPGTAYMLYLTAKRHGAKAAVNTGANSVLGRCAIRLFKKHGLPLINIVRKKEKVDELMKWGAEYVLNSSEPDFEKQYKELATKLGVSVVFDCVGGASATNLVRWSPFGTTVYLYGNMSGVSKLDLTVEELFGTCKGVKGIVNPAFYATVSKEERDAVFKEINAEFKTTFKVDVLDKFALKDFDEAWKKHHENKANNIDGKVVLLVNP